MSLGPRDKLLYARHLLLPEVGTAGQSVLCEARVVLSDGADPRAAEVAGEYLRRAGCDAGGSLPSQEVGGAAAPEVQVASAEVVERLGGAPELREAAAALAGAFAAVEGIKGVLGVGRPTTLDEDLTLR